MFHLLSASDTLRANAETSGGGYDAENLDRLVIYVDAGGKPPTAQGSGPRWRSALSSVCGAVSNWPVAKLDSRTSDGRAADAGFAKTGNGRGAGGSRRFHVPCSRPTTGRYVYIEARGVTIRRQGAPLFSVALCEVMVYQ